jgi:hypothetical protein
MATAAAIKDGRKTIFLQGMEFSGELVWTSQAAQEAPAHFKYRKTRRCGQWY